MSKPNTTEAAKNPADNSARSMYEAVVTTEGTVDGKPARIALYGTRYGACEVESGGEWSIVQDVKFGGLKAISALKGYLDDVAAPAPVAVVAAPIAEAFGLAGSPAVEVAPEAVDARLAEYNAEGDKLAAEGFFGPTSDAGPATQEAAEAAPAAEPVLATLDEVRAAFDAETRGACRASVLRALRVRAGEIALGLPAGGKAEKVKAERAAREPVVVDPTKAKASDVDALRAMFVHNDTAVRDGDTFVFPAAVFTAEAGFPATAREKGNHWRYDRPGVKAAAALGYSVRFDGRSSTVRFAPLAENAEQITVG